MGKKGNFRALYVAFQTKNIFKEKFLGRWLQTNSDSTVLQPNLADLAVTLSLPGKFVKSAD